MEDWVGSTVQQGRQQNSLYPANAAAPQSRVLASGKKGEGGGTAVIHKVKPAGLHKKGIALQSRIFFFLLRAAAAGAGAQAFAKLRGAPQGASDTGVSMTFSVKRRVFLGQGVRMAAACAGLSVAGQALAAPPSWGTSSDSGSLAFEHLHTHEHMRVLMAGQGGVMSRSLQRLNVFLRDHYSGDVGEMDPQLFDVLYRVQQALGTKQPFQVISGYRSPHTNEVLRKTRGGGVARRSLHMDGKAIDVRLQGVPLEELRDAAVALQAGGVGIYRRSNFVHIDTGMVRQWVG